MGALIAWLIGVASVLLLGYYIIGLTIGKRYEYEDETGKIFVSPNNEPVADIEDFVGVDLERIIRTNKDSDPI